MRCPADTFAQEGVYPKCLLVQAPARLKAKREALVAPASGSSLRGKKGTVT